MNINPRIGRDLIKPRYFDRGSLSLFIGCCWLFWFRHKCWFWNVSLYHLVRWHRRDLSSSNDITWVTIFCTCPTGILVGQTIGTLPGSGAPATFRAWAAAGQHLKLSDTELKQAIVAHLTSLRRFCFSLTRTASDGDDLVQATVERLLVKGVPAQVSFVPWMLRVCKNLWIDQLRVSARTTTADTSEIERKLDPIDGAAESFRRLQMHEVTAAISKLDSNQRLVLSLVTVEGYSYREAADILDIPIGTVMSRLARARKYLLEMTQEVI